jgi:hypothetical protein
LRWGVMAANLTIILLILKIDMIDARNVRNVGNMVSGRLMRIFWTGYGENFIIFGFFLNI